jgi:hypothetical protein
MAEYPEKVAAELENIERVLAQLPVGRPCASLGLLELAGVAALLHNF